MNNQQRWDLKAIAIAVRISPNGNPETINAIAAEIRETIVAEFNEGFHQGARFSRSMS